MSDLQDPPPPRQNLETLLAGDTLPAEELLQRAEAKPPLYRVFRLAMYVSYLLIAVWFCTSITVAAWRAVWGEPGRRLQAASQVAPAVGDPPAAQPQGP